MLESTAMIHLLFAAFTTVVGLLLTANVTTMILRALKKNALAKKVVKVLRPFVAYFELGGKSRADEARAHHRAVHDH